MQTPHGVLGNNILHVASRWGQLAIVRSVIARVPLNTENKNGWTPILSAIKFGHSDVAEYLLTKSPTLTMSGRTVLHEAARNGMTTTVEKLILHGLSVHVQDNDNKYTPLHDAVLGRHLPTVQFLVDNAPKSMVC